MTEAKRVSVIVPVYNAAHHLRPCVQSLLAQTYQNIEIILVNDGSSDESGVICDEFAERESRIRVIHQNNAGIAAAQNAGLDASAGDYLTFCDDDDRVVPSYVERLVGLLESTGADMSCCRWANVGESVAADALAEISRRPAGDVATMTDPGRRYQTVFSRALRVLTRTELYYFSEANWGKCYRAELFQGLRFPTGRFAQDVAVAMDLYGRMSLVASCSDVLYLWVQHPQSVSHQLRATRYYHDIVVAHSRSFDLARERGILPARAYTGMKTIRVERSSAKTAADRELAAHDRREVLRRWATLTLWQRLLCHSFYLVRMLENQFYRLTVHRRR